MRYNYEVFITLDEGEQSLVKWQYYEHGGFFMALWKAITTADGGNLDRLELAFPLHVRAYRRFAGESGYWENLQIRLGLLNPVTKEEI